MDNLLFRTSHKLALEDMLEFAKQQGVDFPPDFITFLRHHMAQIDYQHIKH